MLKPVLETVEKITNLYKELLLEFKILENQLIQARENGITYNDVENKVEELEKVKEELENFLNKCFNH